MKIGKLIIEFHVPVTFKTQPDYMKDVIKALKEGRKLWAVKYYKDATGVGLKEAKDYVYDILVPKYYVESKEPIGRTEFRETFKNGAYRGKEWKDSGQGMDYYVTRVVYDTPIGIFDITNEKKTFKDKLKNIWIWVKNN